MDLQFMRNRSLFDPPPPDAMFGSSPGIDISQQGQPVDPRMDPSQIQPQAPKRPSFADAYNEAQGLPSGPASKAYKDFLATDMPQRDSFPVDKTQRLAAILAGGSEGIRHGGAAGVAAASNILDDPYNQAVQDFKLKADKLGTAATQEEKDNTNKTTFYRNFNSDQNTQDRILANDARYSADRQSREDIAAGKLDVSNRRADTAEKRAEIAAKLAEDKGATIQYDKDSGKSFILHTSGKQTPIEANIFNNQDMERMKQAGRLQVVGAQGSNQLRDIEAQGNNQLNLEGKRQIGREGLETTKGINKTNLENTRSVHRIDLKKTPPGTANKPGSTKTTEIKGGGLFGGPKIKVETTTPNQPGAKVTMTNPVDGKPYKIDPSEVEEAKQHGWK